jgi:hypothetical protein
MTYADMDTMATNFDAQIQLILSKMDSAWQEYRFSYVLPAFLTLICFLILRALSSRKLDPREPPIVPSFIPYVGHLIGMVFSGGRYLKHLQYAC